jgi:flagellin
MPFSINTNIASLNAQNYLLQSSNFQAQTIGEVTSGLRIVNSGDDAAGLAVANGLASNQAVLNQGIQNANQGLATLQTIDGGMSNINTLLDRAQTLATESASGTFSGNRTTLNQEFQSVVSEINRQAQSIGLNQGGQYNQNLSVFIGGGQGSTPQAASKDGSISVDLSKSAVDTQSLGLTSFSAQNSTAYNLGTGTTSVANVLADATNQGSETTSGYTTFTFSGQGFGDTVANGTLNQNVVSVSVNLNGVTDTNSLVNAINNAITAQGNASSANDTAFKNAGISAQIVTNSSGQQMLSFSSSNSVFQVSAGDKMANALMGNFAAGTTGAATTTAGSSLIAGGTQQLMNAGSPVTFAFTAPTAAGNQAVTFTTTDANGQVHSTTLNMALATTSTTDSVVEALNNQLQTQNDPVLAGIVAFKDASGNVEFASGNSNPFQVTLGNSTATAGSLGSAGQQGKTYTSSTNGAASTVDISTAQDAQNAINALSTAVSKFGVAQAAVGRGENNLNYAINLATSQSTNEAAAESTIKDANLAEEAANLSKAQILVQAGTAALAQANSAPQQLLALLQGH